MKDFTLCLDFNLTARNLQSAFQCRYSQQHDTSSYYVFHTANGIISHDNPLALWRCCYQPDIMLDAGISTVMNGSRETWRLAGFQRTAGNERDTSWFRHTLLKFLSSVQCSYFGHVVWSGSNTNLKPTNASMLRPKVDTGVYFMCVRECEGETADLAALTCLKGQPVYLFHKKTWYWRTSQSVFVCGRSVAERLKTGLTQKNWILFPMVRISCVWEKMLRL